MKLFAGVVLGAFFALFFYAESDLPPRGDPATPTRRHITPRYIDGAVPQTHTPNIVTAVLADYRSYDTLGETAVILTAGFAVMLILPRAARRTKRSWRERYHNTIVDGVARLLVPFIQIFALYVISHGHYGPGGGFQGGVILAAAVMLLRLTLGEEEEHRFFSSTTAAVLASIGILIYAGTGLVPLFFGGAFLDYGHLPAPGMDGAELRAWGILIVESGVGLVVWGTLVIIFDYLIGNEP